jgi:hypothetical protein
MSAGALFQEALRFVVQQRLPERSQHDVVLALEAARPGPLEFLYEAGTEAKLSSPAIFARGVPIYFLFSAANLCDDLSDDECTYLADARRMGPCAQLTLELLFLQTIQKLQLPRGAMANISRDLIYAAGAQHLELTTKRWSAARFKEVAEGIAGRQWAAYLQILWFGTPLARRARSIGMTMGIGAHVREDIRSGDRRYATMTDRDRREVVRWARGKVNRLRKEGLDCIDAVLMTIDPVLQSAR